MTPLERFKKTCHKYLIMSDDTYIDVIFGAVFANRLDSKPVWLYLVGPPSSGKTEILQALTGPKIYPVSQLTANTLISGWEEAGKGRKKDNSLIPKLNGKVMVIKDFTAMIHSRRENLMTIVGQLRDAYDGTCRNIYGTGKATHYTSKFGVIAGVTNILDKHRGMLAELGERFLTYRCPEVDEKESTERCWKVSSSHSVVDQEIAIRDAASKVLLQPVHKVVLSDSFRNRVIDIAQYVSVAQCEIMRDQWTKEPDIPMPAVATRLTRQLCDLATGIAIVRGSRYISKDIQRLVQKTALDSLTLKRLLLLHTLYNVFPAGISSRKAANKMRYSETIIRRWLEDLHLLDLVSRDTIPKADMPIGDRVVWKICYKKVLHHIWE